MRLSARADYALRAAIELAAAQRRSRHRRSAGQDAAHSGQVPGSHLDPARPSGLVRSQRGPDGGFWLARPASEISLADIIRAIDGPLLGVRGERPENLGYIGAAEPLQTVWIALRANERAILDDVTLEHIVSGRCRTASVSSPTIPAPGPDERACRKPHARAGLDRHHVRDVRRPPGGQPVQRPPRPAAKPRRSPGSARHQAAVPADAKPLSLQNAALSGGAPRATPLGLRTTEPLACASRTSWRPPVAPSRTWPAAGPGSGTAGRAGPAGVPDEGCGSLAPVEHRLILQLGQREVVRHFPQHMR